jgi:sphingolipid C9-methyltransferase
MNRYVFPGADASTPLGFVVDRLESSGFEIKTIDTIGIHYCATLWKMVQELVGELRES